MNSEQSSETGYGLVRTPGSIVTNIGKSQTVDPGWSKFDSDQTCAFSYFSSQTKPKRYFSLKPQAFDKWTNGNEAIYLIIFGKIYKGRERRQLVIFSHFLIFLLFLSFSLAVPLPRACSPCFFLFFLP